MTPTKEIKFETALEKLEGVVRKLEGGALTLEESLKAFEEGIALTRQCEKSLKTAKGKVEKLLQTEGGASKTVPLEDYES